MRPIGRWDVGDPEVDAFVDGNVLSFAAWDLLAYLNRNELADEPLSRLAFLLARQEGDLLPAIRRLVGNGILVEHGPAEDPCYRLSHEQAVVGIVSRFVELASRREYRLEFVRRVLSQITGA